MSTSQHPNAERLAAIAQHLNATPEATAPNQQVGGPYISKEGDYISGMCRSDHDDEIIFGYVIIAYDHIDNISVEVQQGGIETRIMVPGDTPADVIAHTVMSTLRVTIDALAAA